MTMRILKVKITCISNRILLCLSPLFADPKISQWMLHSTWDILSAARWLSYTSIQCETLFYIRDSINSMYSLPFLGYWEYYCMNILSMNANKFILSALLTIPNPTSYSFFHFHHCHYNSYDDHLTVIYFGGRQCSQWRVRASPGPPGISLFYF